jgi:hypothetical protein
LNSNEIRKIVKRILHDSSTATDHPCKKISLNAQVYVDALLCGTIRYNEGINPYIIECGSHMARLITVVGGAVDGILTLCEVEVFSSNPPGF